MTRSTEETVRDVLIHAVWSAYHLGFIPGRERVHGYLLEHEAPERVTEYLAGELADESRELRAWAVDVQGNDFFHASPTVIIRDYVATITAYYALGYSGSGVHALIEHARGVRHAILSLGTHLDGTVDRISEMTPMALQITSSPIEVEGGRMLVGSWTIRAEKRNPDF